MQASRFTLARILAPLAPPLCVACRGEAAFGEPLCPACAGELDRLARGARRLGASGSLCAQWSAFRYQGPARALVATLKFRSGEALATAMAELIAARAPPALLAPSLVPVPAHAAARRRRGFDQAERLAVALGRLTGAPVLPVLRRRPGGRTQVGADRATRLTLDAGAVAVVANAQIERTDLVLVDDVVTTGATLEICAKALVDQGASSVGAVTFASTPAWRDTRPR